MSRIQIVKKNKKKERKNKKKKKINILYIKWYIRIHDHIRRYNTTIK